MKRLRLFRSLIGAALLCAGAFTLCAAIAVQTQGQVAFANLYLVNTTSDAVVLGACQNGDPGCSLRDAIQNANAHPGPDGIFFDLPPGSVINLTAALPDISDGVNISGPGADKLAVQPGGNSVPIRVFNVTATGTVNFSGMTIAHGQPNNDGTQGGGIRNVNAGTVNITNCLFTSNYFTAIANSGTMNITGCTVTGNQSGNSSGGGGIANGGIMTVTNSTVSNNFSPLTGGGIWNIGMLNVIRSTISGNTAYGDFGSNGGGIYNEITSGNMNITGCTIAGNISSGDGGGIYDGARMNVTNCTVSGNSSGQASSTGGSAIAVGPYGGTVLNIKSTIAALNTNNSSASTGTDVSGFFTSAGFNLIGKSDGSTGFNAATDLTGTVAAPLNPKLGPLKNNGGPTYTMALLSGSPAIDKGTSNGLTGTLTTDQRGVGYKRTINKSIANATGGDGTDIGAFESGAHIKAVSRKTHGTAGMFDITLPLTGTKVGVECRKSGSSRVFTVIITFPTAVTVESVSVTPDSKAPGATASVSSSSVSGHLVTVHLTGVST